MKKAAVFEATSENCKRSDSTHTNVMNFSVVAVNVREQGHKSTKGSHQDSDFNRYTKGECDPGRISSGHSMCLPNHILDYTKLKG